MRAALARQLSGIDGVELGELPDPVPAAGQALIRVHGAGVGPWDVGFLGGGFPGLALPFVPGQEVAGVVEAVGDGAGVQPGERVYAVLFPAGGGFAKLAVASADRLAPMPGTANFVEAAGPRFLAASACCSTALAGRPVIRPSMRSATAAGRCPSSCKAPPFRCHGASPANHSLPTAAGRGWSNWPPWSMPANSARRPKRYCHSTRPARRWRGSLPGTLEARLCSKSADCAVSGWLARRKPGRHSPREMPRQAHRRSSR